MAIPDRSLVAAAHRTASLAALAPAYPPDPPPVDYPHLVMGNPSGATADPDRPDNFLLTKPHDAVSTTTAAAARTGSPGACGRTTSGTPPGPTRSPPTRAWRRASG